MDKDKINAIMATERGLVKKEDDYFLDDIYYCKVWNWKPTIDMNQTMECASKVGYIAIVINYMGVDGYTVTFQVTPTIYFTAQALTLELALCKAILKAKGIEIG